MTLEAPVRVDEAAVQAKVEEIAESIYSKTIASDSRLAYVLLDTVVKLNLGHATTVELRKRVRAALEKRYTEVQLRAVNTTAMEDIRRL